MDMVFGFQARFENGTLDSDFNLLDNDYVYFYTLNWDTGLNEKEGKPYTYAREGPELEICKSERVDKILAPSIQQFFPNLLCIKDREEAYMYGDAIYGNSNLLIVHIAPCN